MRSNELLLFVLLFALGCSTDPVRVTTTSNNPAPSGGSGGASVTVAATSADGTVAVSGSSGGSEVVFSRYRYEAPTDHLYTFCLEGAAGSTVAVWNAGETKLSIEQSGCASTYLTSGNYFLDVLRSTENSDDVSVDGGFEAEQGPTTVVRIN